MKKIIFISFFSFIFLFSFRVFAYSFIHDGIYYNVNSDNQTVSVTSNFTDVSINYPNLQNAIIPETIDRNGKTYTVTGIERIAFIAAPQLTNVYIPKTVTSIGEKAFNMCENLKTISWNIINCTEFSFAGCSNVENITFGDEVEYIPADICNGKTKIKSVNIPQSVNFIGSRAFLGCENLEYIELHDDITIYGPSTFGGCNKLKRILIPKKTTTIPDCFCRQCFELDSVTIHEDVNIIWENSFEYCDSLKTVFWNAKNCTYRSYSAFPNSPFYEYNSYDSNLKNFIIGNQVESIPDYLLIHIKSIETITLPESINNIGKYAFYDCEGINTIYSKNTIPPTIDNTVFSSNTENRATLFVPIGFKEAYLNDANWSKFFKIEEMDFSSITNVYISSNQINNIFSLDGKRIKVNSVQELPNGIYIIDNKKTIINR